MQHCKPCWLSTSEIPPEKEMCKSFYQSASVLFGVLCVLVFAAGCAIPVNLPENFDGQIPEGANRFDLISELSVDQMFDQVQKQLESEGFAVKSAEKVSSIIETEGADIGQRTAMRIKLRIQPYERGSRLEAIATWTSDVEESALGAASGNVTSEEEDWWAASWQGKTRASYAYARLVSTFYEMPALERKYVKQ